MLGEAGEWEEEERDLDFLCLVFVSLHLDAFVEHLLCAGHCAKCILYIYLITITPFYK